MWVVMKTTKQQGCYGLERQKVLLLAGIKFKIQQRVFFMFNKNIKYVSQKILYDIFAR
jgi:hypothetical protein